MSLQLPNLADRNAIELKLPRKVLTHDFPP